MAKRQLYYRGDVRDAERLLGYLLAERADFHFTVLAGALDWLGVKPDFDKVRAHENQRELPAWDILDKSLTIEEILETETEVKL